MIGFQKPVGTKGRAVRSEARSRATVALLIAAGLGTGVATAEIATADGGWASKVTPTARKADCGGRVVAVAGVVDTGIDCRRVETIK